VNRDDFLQAIIENPDDDALRRAFAGTLQVDGELERAEFIRVQIELAKLSNVDSRRKGLEQRVFILNRNITAVAAPRRRLEVLIHRHLGNH